MAIKQTNVCLLCGEEKSTHQCSKHRNINISEHFGFCKDCLKLKVNDEDVNGVIDMLRLMNIPFISSVWENAVEKGGSSIFSKYLQLIATQKKYKDFGDSVYDYDDEIQDSSDPSKTAFVVTDEIIARWGSLDNTNNYIELELSLESLKKIKEPQTYLEQQRYVQNVQLGKALNDALKAGAKEIPALRKSYADDLKELGLDILSASKDDNRSLGMRIAEWERHDPIPEAGDEFEDVDGINSYIRKWFLIPMKRVFGQATEQEVAELYEGLG